MLVRMPLATGSPAYTKTIGIVRVCSCTAFVSTLELTTIMSGRRSDNSRARGRSRLMFPPAQRWSVRKLRPLTEWQLFRPDDNILIQSLV